jgi:trk system potassium uptake protein TrkA
MKFAVIGLGSFGSQIARSITGFGHEVTAIDIDKACIDRIKSDVTVAVCMNSTSKEDLVSIGIQDMDVVVVSLGPALEPSILTVHYLHELGVKRIVAKALNEDHAEILESVGATEVVYPERDMAVKTAIKLVHPNILEYLEVTAGVFIQEIAPPDAFIGKSLKELDLINRYGIQVVAVRELVPERVTFIPRADFVIKPSDILIIIGEEANLSRINGF